MKITNVTVQTLQVPESRSHTYLITQVQGLRRTQYTHTTRPAEGPTHLSLMRVQTDEGLEGICTLDSSYVGDARHMVETLKANVLGLDAFDREFIFQKLQLGTRWVYQRPGWFGTFDNCLWDITGKAAGLPIFKLLGKVRPGLPVYMTAGDGPLEMYIEHIEKAKEMGIRAYKPHSYKGGKADIPIMCKLREHVGPDYDLILDPVCSYTLREAIEVGHVLEELDFVWLEEPFHEQRMNDYQELCAELTIPVMATETLMHDMGLTAQWLIQGATDRLRGNARSGATQVLKLAHFAELYGTNIELNGIGGLFGLVHAMLGCSIHNTDFFEQSGYGHACSLGVQMGLTNPPQVVDGRLIPPEGPGWGAEWDMQRVQQLTVATV
ncbi:MAG: enolase C-terminal domain-like protein [Chloroflexota bacterium]